jgi:hypothetical protein
MSQSAVIDGCEWSRELRGREMRAGGSRSEFGGGQSFRVLAGAAEQ